MQRTDFIDNLPEKNRVELSKIVKAHKDEEWFEDFWSDYRNHVLTHIPEQVRMPFFFVKKYTLGE